MIVDNLKNIYMYETLNNDIFEGLKFLQNLNHDIQLGEYQITPNAKAIVSEYYTKEKSPERYESHDNVIDIQYVAEGQELVHWSYLNDMKKDSSYDINKDRTFYIEPINKSKIIIGNGIFAIFFKEDAHCPSLTVNGRESTFIKKVTVKVNYYYR